MNDKDVVRDINNAISYIGIEILDILLNIQIKCICGSIVSLSASSTEITCTCGIIAGFALGFYLKNSTIQ